MRCILVALALVLVSAPAVGVDLLPGDVVVLEPTNDSVVRVRPGDYEEGNPEANQVVITQGNLIASPYDVAIGDGVLFVTDQANESIVRVDLSTGDQTLVPLDPVFGIRPRGIAINQAGQLLVGDRKSAALLQVDPDTGGAGTLTPNIFLNTPLHVGLGPGEEIFVAESGQGLQRIDPAQQTATRVAGSFVSGRGLAVDPQTGALFSSNSTEISRFDPDTFDAGDAEANREVIFDDNATDLGLLPNGDLVATAVGSTDLMQIDLETKLGTTVAEGGNLLIPTGLAVVRVPEPEAALGALMAGLVVAILSRRLPRPSMR